jgi:Ca2+-binding RTX toxin-like protein
MSTYYYSNYVNDTIDFDPSKDVLYVDSDGPPAYFGFSDLSDGSGVTFGFANQTQGLVLSGITADELTSDNVVFLNGLFLTPSLSNNYASTLVGAASADLLVGSKAPVELGRVSITETGQQSSGYAANASVSANGRFVVFESDADDLTGQTDSDGANDIFVKDLLTGTVIRASETAAGDEGSATPVGAIDAAISADGRFVVFESGATNLVANDTNGKTDVFLKNLETGAITRVSTSTSGAQAGAGVDDSSISVSADGRYVSFTSASTNLVTGDTNGLTDVFVKDTQTGQLTRVSTSAGGVQGNGNASDARLSADGKFVVFESSANNLAGGPDINGNPDIFIKNLQTGAISCVSLDLNGDYAIGMAYNPDVSADGRYVVFESSADLLGDGQYGTFVRDMQTGTLTHMGPGTYDENNHPRISGDGRFVVFTSAEDVYVKDLQTGEQVQLPGDVWTTPFSQAASISADGSTIVFNSEGSGLVEGDTNSTSDVFVVANPLYVRTLSGGSGDDAYVISNASDVIVEVAGGGDDTVRSSLSIQLAANVERLELTGTSAINGTGNALGNFLTGNAAANVLDGRGGGDYMSGGLGDDTYYVDAGTDRITEFQNQGVDTVRSSVSLNLSSNVENLELSGSAGIAATGNTGDNRITGNAGNNVLNGGAGNDTVSYANASGAVSVDLTLTGAQATGGAGTDTLNGFEGITGSAYADSLHGSSGDNTISGGGGADTMTGGSGNDIYIVDNAGDKTIELAGGGIDLVQSSVTFTLQAEVENLTLTGSAPINGTGNALANVLKGNAGANALYAGGGNDRLDGGAGADTLTGGAGNDTYVVDNAGDQAVEVAGGGIDAVQSSVSFQLQSEFEKLTLTGNAAINGTGNALANTITGNSAANVLGGGAGADTLTGGAGNDTYVVDDAGDQMVELAGGGIDLIRSSISIQLQAEFENLVLTGIEAINGTGNSLANAITGNSAANVLGGGAGADTLTGGSGNDTYVVDNAGDIAREVAGGGVDLVRSSVSFTLQAELENLTLTGSSAINATGNSLANILTGNAADNVLGGGAGADTMTGGAGNDTYVVDNAGDKVVEAASGGTDLVRSSVSFQLLADMENLTLTGAAAINGTGNALANVITGNSAANVLGGGDGADTLTGGGGDDTYVVDNLDDRVVEEAGGGVDTIRSAITITLSTDVENLALTGTAALNGSGNYWDNVITGNSGNNRLDGRAGADTMAGGAGDDVYIVDDTGDTVVESAGAGTDVVQSSASFVLSAGLENLTLTGFISINGTGNAGANVIIGTSADNRLDGGAGTDTLQGGAGDDVYVVDQALDHLVEAAGAGRDTVQSAVSWVLGADFEDLRLTGSAAASATGNSMGNDIDGNAGNNTIDGGLGSDFMSGGLGSDTFVMHDTRDDLVLDFDGLVDKVLVDQSDLRVGDGDLVVDGAVDISGPGGFSTSAELVVVTKAYQGAMTLDAAASMIGSANGNYAVGDTRVFAVHTAGGATDLLYFKSADSDGVVEASELSWMVTLGNGAEFSASDLLFGA